MNFEEWKRWQQAGAPEDIEGWREKEVEKVGGRGIISARGDALSYSGAGGAIPRDDLKRMDEHAERFYEEIRHRTTDVEAIAKNTGFSAEDITNIKRHVFFEKHDVGEDEPRRFDPSYDMAVSWQRLIDGREVLEMDIVMLRHEMLELEYMVSGMSYEMAHRHANERFNYQAFIDELDRKAGKG